MTKPRLLLHAQQFRGTGHRIRMVRLARALASHFSVVLLDGGPPDPRIPLPADVRTVPLEPLVRDGLSAEVRPWSPDIRLAAALERRRRTVVEVTAEVRPVAVVIEFYPFSRWLLTAEVEAMIATARAARPGALALSSVRDVLETGFETESQGGRGDRKALVERLKALDAVLVHGDAGQGLWAADLESLVASVVPVVHTGYVAPAVAGEIVPSGRAGTVVSVGGGFDGASLISATLDAWTRLKAGGLGARLRPLRVFLGPYLAAPDAEAIRTRCGALGVCCEPFSERFLPTLASAALSISRGGYNTCADLLSTRVPAIVSPTRINDQLRRARHFERLGRVVVADDTGESIACAVPRALGLSPGPGGPRLDGAERTAGWIAARLAERARAVSLRAT